ncbi:hypothetical protein AMTR_s00007p00028590 [Amborella trichopoda]|uniref:Uncharacterized protein n=1 Tax=Amborella trichopoda TaxID=13333 RepID=W1P5S0_AMBTC|nr:hypothetical protein AMTR_s00007p00028590 [Amborella trichopoda]
MGVKLQFKRRGAEAHLVCREQEMGWMHRWWKTVARFPKSKEKRAEVLVRVYEEETCNGGYPDIQVMWDLLHSSALSSSS